MAAQDPSVYGIRQLTDEERQRVADNQARYQQGLQARQTQQAAQFENTLSLGLANQANRAYVPQAAAVTPAQLQPTALQQPPSVQPATPAMDQSVVAQPQPQPQQQATTLSPEILADANQRIADTLAANQAPAQIAGERGNYNMANTSTVDAQGNVTSNIQGPQSAGLGGLGSFGGESASQYLQRMAQQDQQQAAAVAANRREAQEGVQRIGLRNAITQGSPQERRAARQELEALDQRAGLRVQDTGATQRQSMQNEGEQLRAQIAGQAGVQSALARAAGAQQAAQIAGQFGLQRAETTALGRIGAAEITANTAAQSGSNVLAQQRARQLQIQEQLLRQAQEAGDVSGAFAAAGLSRPPAPVYTDPLTGAPLSEEAVRILQQQAMSRLVPQQ